MRRAFTLVELIVVVIIIGILLSIGIPQYRKALERSRGAEGYASLGHIQEAEKIYFASNEVYLPTASPMPAADQQTLDISLPQSGWSFGVVLGALPATFTATATRTGGGPCAATIMTVDQRGTLTERGVNYWRDCVDGL